MTFQCKIAADTFRRALSCVSTEQTRFYLCGVNIEPAPNGGALAVSTDGTRMICLRDAEGSATGQAIVAADAASVRAIKGKHAAFVAVDGDRLTVTDKHGGALHIQAGPALIADATFPEWRRVVPRGDLVRASESFNALMLAPLAVALSGDGFGKSACAALFRADGFDGGPMIVRGGYNVDGFGVLMPLRDNAAAPVIPAWADEAPAAVESLALAA